MGEGWRWTMIWESDEFTWGSLQGQMMLDDLLSTIREKLPGMVNSVKYWLIRVNGWGELRLGVDKVNLRRDNSCLGIIHLSKVESRSVADQALFPTLLSNISRIVTRWHSFSVILGQAVHYIYDIWNDIWWRVFMFSGYKLPLSKRRSLTANTGGRERLDVNPILCSSDPSWYSEGS